MKIKMSIDGLNLKIRKKTKLTNSGIGILVGIFGFLITINPRIVLPWNIGWISQTANSDLLANYYGWNFFRKSQWGFPIGKISDYGVGITTTIIHTDSIPLLAIPLKVISGILPPNFQYFGFWILASFLLQGYFGSKLVQTFSQSVLLNVLGSTLFIFTPVFLIRTNVHIALTSHFLILAALYLYLKSENPDHAKWACLLLITSLIHPYFLTMVFPIWIAALIRNKTQENYSKLKYLLVGTCGLIVACWVMGYFLVLNSIPDREHGWGIYPVNLLSPLSPSGWSLLLNKILPFSGNFEGFSYLGLGLLMAIPISMVIRKSNTVERNIKAGVDPVIIIVVSLLALFAITNHVGVGHFKIVYPVPEYLIDLFSVFRASGRMIWPAIYLGTLLVLRIFAQKFIRLRYKLVLLTLVIVQVLDTSAGYGKLYGYEQKQNLVKISAQWDQISRGKDSIMVIPLGNENLNWSLVGYVAIKFKLRTNCVYQARVNANELSESKRKIIQELSSGRMSVGTIYILTDAEKKEYGDFLAKNGVRYKFVDGLNVYYFG
jgi:hypothetical protein